MARAVVLDTFPEMCALVAPCCQRKSFRHLLLLCAALAACLLHDLSLSAAWSVLPTLQLQRESLQRYSAWSAQAGDVNASSADGGTTWIWPSLFKLTATVSLLCFMWTLLCTPVSAGNPVANYKIKAGGASTFDRGSRKNITRGVNLDESNFTDQDLTGVSFQQSIVRNSKFKNAKLENTSFFDANLEFSDFTGARMNGANFELARLQGTNFTNAIATEMYVNSATRMEPTTIEGADFTDTPFRKDQLAYLCSIAKGTNPVTKVDTKESLQCPE